MRRPRLIVTFEVTGIRASATSCCASVLRTTQATVEAMVADGDAAAGRQDAGRGREAESTSLARAQVGVTEARDGLLDGLGAEALLQPRGDLVDAAVRDGVAQVVAEAV